MADGDEKIDHNDRVFLLNRLADAKHEGLFNGITVAWNPRQTRSIQRQEALHFIQQSRVLVDPTGLNPGVYKLVEVDETGAPVEEGAATEPLTLAECRELAKFGFLDTTNLPPDRQFGADGSMQMIDPETGQHPATRQLRSHAASGPIPAAPARLMAPPVSDAELAAVRS